MMREDRAAPPARRCTYWLITRYEGHRMEVFTADLDGAGEVLPIFGFEQEAAMFLRLGTLGTGWQARETWVGELLSFLYGPCGGIERVALDPLPQIFDEAVLYLLCMNRKDFVRTLAGRRIPDLRWV